MQRLDVNMLPSLVSSSFACSFPAWGVLDDWPLVCSDLLGAACNMNVFDPKRGQSVSPSQICIPFSVPHPCPCGSLCLSNDIDVLFCCIATDQRSARKRKLCHYPSSRKRSCARLKQDAVCGGHVAEVESSAAHGLRNRRLSLQTPFGHPIHA